MLPRSCCATLHPFGLLYSAQTLDGLSSSGRSDDTVTYLATACAYQTHAGASWSETDGLLLLTIWVFRDFCKFTVSPMAGVHMGSRYLLHIQDGDHRLGR